MKINGSNEVAQKTNNRSIVSGEMTKNDALFEFDTTNDKNMGLQVEAKCSEEKLTKEIRDKNGNITKKISLTARGAVNVTEYDDKGRVIKDSCYDLKNDAVRVYDAEEVDLENFNLVFYDDIKYDNQNGKQLTRFYENGNIGRYELRNQYDQVLELITYTDSGNVTHHEKNKYDGFMQISSEDLTGNYEAQKYNRMVVERDKRGVITKTIERIAKGCLVITEYNNGKTQVKTYAPKDIVNWEEPDLNNINWNNYEPFDL